MIRQECFTKEWIQQLSTNLQYPDVNLIEKAIRAFPLWKCSQPPAALSSGKGAPRCYWVKTAELM